MIGAIISRLKVKDPATAIAPDVVVLALVLALLIVRALS
jgi:hypothetical protein